MGSTFYKQFVWIALGIYALLSIIHGASLSLTADEAHYALYGSKLDWSYFDHPPMVGWLQSVALLFGDHEFILRIFPLLFSGLSLFLLFRAAKISFGEHTAYLTLLLFLSAPILHILPIGMIPETPLVLIGLALLNLLLDFDANTANWKQWSLLGLLLGLAGLSKYTGVTLGLSVAALILWQCKGQVWKIPGLFLALLITLLLLTPVFYWNAQHDWISFVYQMEHGAGRYEANWQNAAKMQAGQLGAFGPLIYVLGWVAVVSWFRQTNQKWNPYLVLGLPILILFSITAAKGRSLPHWTELGVIILLPIFADWVIRNGRESFHKYWIIGLTALSALIVIVAQVLLFQPPIKFDDFKHPTRDLIGWKEIGKEMASVATDTDHLFVPNWSFASRIGWYAKPYPVKVLDTRFDQFDMWFGSVEQGDSGILLLLDEGKGFKTSFLEQFDACDMILDRKIQSGPSLVNHFKLYRCDHYNPKQP